MQNNSLNKHNFIASVIFCCFLCLSLLGGFFPALVYEPTIVENRNLAEPPTFEENSLKSYFQKYEEYFNDHFGFRKLFLRLLALYKYNFFDTTINSTVMIGKENWLFDNYYKQLLQYRGKAYFNATNLVAIRRYLTKKKQLLAKRGIDYLYVIAPNKHSIYPEYFPSDFHPAGETYIDTFVKYMKETSEVDILDLRPSLIDNKDKGKLFHYTDMHWNSLGAFYGYQAIIKKLAPKYPSIKMIGLHQLEIIENKFFSGGLAGLMGLTGVITETEHIYKLKNKTVSTAEGGQRGNAHYAKNNNYSGPRVLMFHDSFTRKLKPFLSESFSSATFIHTGVWPKEEELLKLLDQVKPDIVIEQRVEWGIKSLTYHALSAPQAYLR